MRRSFDHVVFVSAPQGTGKTTNAQALMAMFGCTSVVEEWDGVSPVPNGALGLTNEPWPGCSREQIAA